MNNRTFAWGAIQRCAKRLQEHQPHLSDAEAISRTVASGEGAFWYGLYKRAARQGEAVELPPAEPIAKREEPSPRERVWHQIQAAAQEIRKRDPRLTEAQAVVQVLKATPDLYQAYRAAARG